MADAQRAGDEMSTIRVQPPFVLPIMVFNKMKVPIIRPATVRDNVAELILMRLLWMPALLLL